MSLNLARWGGLAAILGGAVFFTKILWDLAGIVPAYTFDVTDALFFLVPLLWLVGLAAFCAQHAERYGALGKAGFTTGLIGLAAGFVGSLLGVWAEPLGLLYWLGFRFLCHRLGASGHRHYQGASVAARVGYLGTHPWLAGRRKGLVHVPRSNDRRRGNRSAASPKCVGRLPFFVGGDQRLGAGAAARSWLGVAKRLRQ